MRISIIYHYCKNLPQIYIVIYLQTYYRFFPKVYNVWRLIKDLINGCLKKEDSLNLEVRFYKNEKEAKLRIIQKRILSRTEKNIGPLYFAKRCFIR